MRDKLERPKSLRPKTQKIPIYEKLLLVHLQNYVCNRQIGRGKLILQHQNINCCQLTDIFRFLVENLKFEFL